MSLLIRRAFALIVAVLLGTAGLQAAGSVAHAASNPGADPRSSAAQVAGTNVVRYCVDNYAPNSSVDVANSTYGENVGTITTDSSGHGCTEIRLHNGCQVVTAHGFDQQGNPATSSVQICVSGIEGSRATSGTAAGSGTLPFTGADVVPVVGAAAALIVVGMLLVAAVRRRRQVSI